MCPFNDAVKFLGTSSQNDTSKEATTNSTTDIAEEKKAKASAFSILFCSIAYGYVFVVFVFTFLLTFIVPKSVGSYLPFMIFDYNLDQNSNDDATVSAIATNVSLMLLFCTVHSTLARNSVKKMMTIPATFERPVFVLQSAALLHLLMHFWKGFETPLLWSVQNQIAEYAIMAIQIFGILFLLTGSFALDHFHLFGLTQGFGIDFNKIVRLSPRESDENRLVVRFHYALVAHPLMTGIFLSLWAVPRMTGSRFLLAAIFSTYILLAVKYLEEPQITQMVGEQYTEYLQRVPRYIPFAWPALRSAAKTTDSSSSATGESSFSSSKEETPLKETKLPAYGNISV